MRSPASPSTIGVDELVGHARGVARLDRRRGRLGALPHAVHERRARELGALDAMVAIHRVVAADDGRDRRARAGPLALELREQAGRLVRRDVAAVGERVHGDARHARRERRAPRSRAGGRRASARRRRRPGRRRAARRGRRARPRRPPAAPGCGQRAVGHGVADAHEVLRDDASGADVEVADLGVAHLAVGQPHGAPRARSASCAASAPRARRRPACAPARRRCPAPSGAQPKPSSTTSATGPRHQPASAARAIAAKLCGSRLAPPTSAPSTSGCASSSAAFSGLTEPP